MSTVGHQSGWQVHPGDLRISSYLSIQNIMATTNHRTMATTNHRLWCRMTHSPLARTCHFRACERSVPCTAKFSANC
jgi:hypothetical protein